MRPVDRVKEPAHAVKGIIGADELPLEARVSRSDECRLKQKVGYGQHADPTRLQSGKPVDEFAGGFCFMVFGVWSVGFGVLAGRVGWVALEFVEFE